MIWRIRRHPESNSDRFEKTALRITGFAFYTFAVGLFPIALYNIATAHKPLTTLWGVVVSLISITVMWVLVWAKRQEGRRLGSEAILADASCTQVCIYMSVILLVASAVYMLAGIPYIDAVGTIGLAYFSLREGRESFEKASENTCCSCA
jgi:divalent metal cation (Fe/Co/Zn/Cd) transporter